MRRNKKVLLFWMAVCLMALSFAIPAAAAEVSEDKYTHSVSKSLGEVDEVITFEDLGELYEDMDVTSTLVPDKAILTFTAKAKTSAVVLGYSLENGILVSESLPWTIKGKKQLVNSFAPNTTGTVTFEYGLPYYELYIADEETGNQTSYFFKIDKGNVSGDQPDAWAKTEVEAAIAGGLVPEGLQSYYKQQITRADFAKLIVNLLEVTTGKTIDAILEENEVSLSDNPFADTTIKQVIAANLMGIVNGKGNGIFDPYGSITRQEAAVMLTNTVDVFGFDITGDPSTFADSKAIASWAKPSVDFVFTYGVMNGTGNNNFSPKGTYTRQQAFTTILRLSDLMSEE
ncbi:S-layer homology domain-containing protein [Paenibacillus sinopodophylli]|uniref:S-layer homology domain-containing protein n=1 Tax=Paenibacillus sinopodophylli TaxID=1837342 RepID=UPI00110CAD65|nr:S-layer homology domain-containing protein [Paenibacillus sinopodophylli]